MHKILIVDDSRAALSALNSQLDPSVYAVTTETSPTLALEKLKTEPSVDCILSDYEMPDLNGPEFCRQLKAHETTKHIPVIILTSQSEAEHVLCAIEAGADNFITKTTDARIIVAKINAMLRLKRIQEDLSRLRRADGIRQIIATYNHEFNNPLAIAIGNISFLRGMINEEAQLVRVNRASDALNRIANLVKKIRDLRDFVEEGYTANETMVSLSSKENSDP